MCVTVFYRDKIRQGEFWMNYTTNYHLPQWVESDRILMEDFNEAMESIEEGLSTKFSADNRPYVSGSFTVPSDATSGTVVLVLDFQPHHILLTEGSTIAIRQEMSETLYTSPTSSAPNNYYVTLQLSGNQIKFQSRGSGTTGSVYVTYIAYQ